MKSRSRVLLASGSETVLQELSDREDTLRAIEEILLEDYGFPERGPALLAVDYLQRVPVIGLTGLVAEDQRSGEAAAGLRRLARRHNWAVMAACALRAEHFSNGNDLSALLGDERVPYEADRVLLVQRKGLPQKCGCVVLEVCTLKNRTGPARGWQLEFWGERFYPALHFDETQGWRQGTHCPDVLPGEQALSGDKNHP